jgi:hypothetical protein
MPCGKLALSSQRAHTAEVSGIVSIQAQHAFDVIPIVQTSVSCSALAAQLSPPRKPTKPFGDGCVGALLMTRLSLALVGSTLLLALYMCPSPFLMPLYQRSHLLLGGRFL